MSDTPLILRPLRPEDLPQALALLGDAELPTGGVAEGRGRFVVAEAEGAPVGLAGLERYGPSALLRSVVVSAGWRGRGVGDTLIRHLLDAAGQEGVTAVYLLTETAPGFFARHGFVRVERSEVPEEVRASDEFRELCPASAIAMGRSVAPADA